MTLFQYTLSSYTPTDVALAETLVIAFVARSSLKSLAALADHPKCDLESSDENFPIQLKLIKEGLHLVKRHGMVFAKDWLDWGELLINLNPIDSGWWCNNCQSKGIFQFNFGWKDVYITFGFPAWADLLDFILRATVVNEILFFVDFL